MSHRNAAMLVAALGACLATSEAEPPLPPSAIPSAIEFDTVDLQTTATSGAGINGGAGSRATLYTTAQPGAESVDSALQIEWIPANGFWEGDITITVADTRTARTWSASADTGSGTVYLELEDAYQNCWGAGFVPSCDSAFEVTVSGPAGTVITWDARLMGATELGDYQPGLSAQAQ